MHANRVRETTATTGTGTFNLAGAPAGFRSFVQAFGSGKTVFYVAVLAAQWEIGLGTLAAGTPDTLARTQIIANSNGDNNPVNFAAGSKTIFNTLPAGFVSIPVAGALVNNSTGTLNDVNPQHYGVVTFGNNAATTITGFSGGYDGRSLLVINAGGVHELTLGGSGSSAGNGIYTPPGGGAYKLPPDGGMALLVYRTLGWVVLAQTPGPVMLHGIATAPQITADQNDYTPIGGGTGVGSVSVVRISSDAARNITGLSGGSHQKLVQLTNVGSFDIALKGENAGSAAANRFSFGGGDILLGPGRGVMLWYDDVSDRWRSAAAPSASNSPAFLAYQAGVADDVTGDGTAYTVPFSGEIIDTGGNWASNTFTAPVTGMYLISGVVTVKGLTSLHTAEIIVIDTSNRDYYVAHVNPYQVQQLSNGFCGIPFSACVDMDAGDTAIVTVTVSGGTKVVDLVVGTPLFTYVGGGLIR